MEETLEITDFQPFAFLPKDPTYYWSATEQGGYSKGVWSMRFYPDDHITGYWIYAGYNDKTQKSCYLRCIRDIPQ